LAPAHALQTHSLLLAVSALPEAVPCKTLLQGLRQLAQVKPSHDLQLLLVPGGIELLQEHWHAPDAPPELEVQPGMWAWPAAL
jgi:hypothetical protein